MESLSIGTKLAMHASIYAGIVLYHSHVGSWQSALDLGSACAPAVPPYIDAICLPDLTDLAAYLPLHVLLSLCFSVILLAVHFGGILLQLSAFAALGLLLGWSEIPSGLSVAGLAGVVTAQLLVFAVQTEIKPRSSLVLCAVEISLFPITAGLARACFD